jgi:uncharacterized membrane protein YeaQ/YmgE (transglycosylase-associated protein family)
LLAPLNSVKARRKDKFWTPDGVVQALRRLLDASGMGDRPMAFEALIVWLFVGALAGWSANIIAKAYGFGLFGHMVVGMLGGFIGGWLFMTFGAATDGGVFGEIVSAVSGAIALLFLARFIRTPRDQV